MYSYLYEHPHRVSTETLLLKIFNEEKAFYLRKGDVGYSYFGFQPTSFFDSSGQKNPLEHLNMLFEEYIRKEKKSSSCNDTLFRGGLVGYLSYELGKHIYNLASSKEDDLNTPLYAWGIYDAVIIYEHATHKVFISYKNKKDLKKMLDWLKIPGNKNGERISTKENRTKIKNCLSREDYFSSIHKIQDYLYNGEIYQVNFAHRFSFAASRNILIKLLPELVYEPHSAFLNFSPFSIVSFSPERFLKLDLNGIIMTQPIKGTTPRGTTLEEDLKQKRRLEESEKDQAEHVMIVDLERNDLGRISQAPSVTVPEFMKAYSFKKVHHLVSTVQGRLKENIKIMDILTATFPGGSITGAPKKRAMQIIEELEPVSRGIYTGSIGYIDFRGSLDLNIAIRTLIYKENLCYFSVGGGIVIDSTASQEYEETLVKSTMIVDNL